MVQLEPRNNIQFFTQSKQKKLWKFVKEIKFKFQLTIKSVGLTLLIRSKNCDLFCIERWNILSQKNSRKCSRISKSLEMKIVLRKHIILVSRMFFQILIPKMSIKMNLRLIMKNLHLIQTKSFPENRFYSNLDSRVSSDSVGVNKKERYEKSIFPG